MAIRISFLIMPVTDREKMRIQRTDSQAETYRQSNSFPRGGQLTCSVSKAMGAPGFYLW